MARDRVAPFLETIEQACIETSVLSVIEAMRIFGYVSEDEYSKLTTGWTKMTRFSMVRIDGAETIELARENKLPQDPEEILPREY